MRKSIGVLLGTVLLLGLSASAFAKGSNPQFPAPAPASWYVNACTGAFTIEWTAVTTNIGHLPPTKYAIEIVQTLHSSCPDGPILGTQVNNFTSPGNTTEFTTPDGILQLFGFPFVCDPGDIVILVKALNPPGKSQNNPQAIAGFEAIGGGCGP